MHVILKNPLKFGVELGAIWTVEILKSPPRRAYTQYKYRYAQYNSGFQS